jgi:NTE family protein
MASTLEPDRSAEAPDAPPVPVVRRRRPAPRTVLAVASLGSAVAFVDATIVNIAFPDIAKSFPGSSISSLSWVLNAYNIVFAAFLVAAGRIADVAGRRRLFVMGLEVFTAASLLCAIAPSPGALIAFRVVQALGAALLVPSSLALVLDAFPVEHRSHGVALLGAVAAVAAGLGPSLGGLLVAAANWRLVFLVNLPIGIAAVVLARRFIVESRAPGRRRLPDLLGAFVLALAVAALVLGVVKGPDWGWGSAGVLGSFAAALALFAYFGWRCSWHRSAIVDLGLLRNRTFSVANVMTILTAAGFYGYTLTNVLYLTGVWRYSILEAGLAMTPGPFVAAAVAGPSSRLIQRIGHRPVLVAGGLIWGAAVLWLIERVGTTPAFLSEWLPGIVLLGIGAGILLPNLSGAAIASAPGTMFATATGLNSVARQFGAAMGVAIVVAIIGTPSPLGVESALRDAWTFASACLFAAGLGCLLVGRLSVAATPSLADATREVLQSGPSEVPEPQRAPAPHPVDMLAPSTTARAESAAEFLRTAPLFSELDSSVHEALASRTRTVRVGAGDWLFHQGDPADAMYVVRAGRLEIIDERDASVLRELGRGDALGELALLTDSPRSAGVRAARGSDLIAIARTDFEQLLETAPAVSLALNRTLAEQLRATGAAPPTARPRPGTVAVISVSPGPAAALARELAEALSVHVSTALLNGAEAEGPSPTEEPAARYGPVLDRAEASHELVLLDAGSVSDEGPWTRFCLQQADRILAIAAGGPVPGGLASRTELRRCDLVVVDVTPSTGALEGWGAALDPVESHVVQSASRREDVARIARRLTGRSTGIVLSGGGARAFSHIGVLEELAAAGIRIDRVAGVSMGAFIGALFAMGLDAEEMDACCFEEWVQRRPLSDYTIPRHSLIRGERFRSMLHRTFDRWQVEELPRSFMCGCTELRSGSLVMSRHGPLWEAVGFSICLPIVAPPQVRGREIYIDGSLVDNLPIGAMAGMGEGPVIAVDVKASFEHAPPGSPGDPVPRSATARTPSLGETLTRVLLLGSANTSEAAERHADLVIKPRAHGVGLLEFHQLDAAREAGRAAAREALENASSGLFG